ncbi:hypothetical protein WH357_21435 [Enterobacter ludwigii]
METVKQLTLRVRESLTEGLKARASTEGRSVNALAEDLLAAGLENGSGDQADYARMVAEPEKSLAQFYRLLSRYHAPSENAVAPVSESEIRFLAKSVIGELNYRDLPLPAYYRAREIADNALKTGTITIKDVGEIFPLTIPYYLQTTAQRNEFARVNTPDDIKTDEMEFESSDVLVKRAIRFRVNVEGTLRNRISAQELHVAPLVSLYIWSDHFGITMNWQRYMATVRLAELLEHQGYEATTPILNGISFVKRDFWLIRLEDIDIRLTQDEMKEFCAGLLAIHNDKFKDVMQTMRYLFGE